MKLVMVEDAGADGAPFVYKPPREGQPRGVVLED